MSIMSFLVIPKPGEKKQLYEQLSKIKNCEVLESTNKDLFVVVTDVSTVKEDEDLFELLQGLSSLQSLNLVYGQQPNDNYS